MHIADPKESEPALVPREDGQYPEESGRRGTLDTGEDEDKAGTDVSFPVGSICGLALSKSENKDSVKEPALKPQGLCIPGGPARREATEKAPTGRWRNRSGGQRKKAKAKGHQKERDQ